MGDHDTAREQYAQIAGRNRADLGLESARKAAAAEAALYADPVIPRYQRPAARRSIGDRLSAVVDQLDQDDQQVEEVIDDDLAVDTPHQRGPGHRPAGPRL